MRGVELAVVLLAAAAAACLAAGSTPAPRSPACSAGSAARRHSRAPAIEFGRELFPVRPAAALPHRVHHLAPRFPRAARPIARSHRRGPAHHGRRGCRCPRPPPRDHLARRLRARRHRSRRRTRRRRADSKLGAPRRSERLLEAKGWSTTPPRWWPTASLWPPGHWHVPPRRAPAPRHWCRRRGGGPRAWDGSSARCGGARRSSRSWRTRSRLLHTVPGLHPRRLAGALRRARRRGGRTLPRPAGAANHQRRHPGAGRVHVEHDPDSLESFIFMLIGLELPDVVRALRSHSHGRAGRLRCGLALAAIVVRLIYTFAAAWVLASRAAAGASRPSPPGRRRASSGGRPCGAATRWSSPWRCRSGRPRANRFPPVS